MNTRGIGWVTLAGTLAACSGDREGDDARMARDLDRARQLDLAALERAPRHPEIARRIAEVDRTVGGRAEAASATLREIVNGLIAWSGAHLAEVDAARARYDARAKRPQWAASDV